ncbi:MAG: prepilin-type N-terminal cleavage/methylation domain-containing protein [Clostridiales Family XIII bacterium]|nr:prepilin-type N-terminal cleavage/methylation domain-containing protein [Clostridiales Family XIII bacterium]
MDYVKRGALARSKKGMTLVEVMVAFAIVAVVSVSAIAGLMTALNTQMRAVDSKNDAAAVEKQIAEGEALPADVQDLNLTFAGYAIGDSSADTYTDGSRSYTVVTGENAKDPFVVLLGDMTASQYTALSGKFGTTNVNSTRQANGKCYGGNGTFSVPVSGVYRIECWGAGSDGATGPYAMGEIRLVRGTKLYLFAGGRVDNPTSGVLYNNGMSDVRIVAGEWDYSASLAGRLIIGGTGYGSAFPVVEGYTFINTKEIMAGVAAPDPLDTGYDPFQPDAPGATVNGNSGGGMIRITYLGSETE